MLYRTNNLFFKEKLLCRCGGRSDEAVLIVERGMSDVPPAEAEIILRAPLREKVKYIVLKHIAERHDAVRRNDRGGIRDRLCEAVRASFKLNFNCAVALCR